MFRRFLPVFLAIAIAIPVLAGRLHSGHDAVFDQINSIVKTLSEISGLAEEHPVPYGRMNKTQLRKFLAKRIKKTLKPEEIAADELALKMFGLVPQDFDLKKSTIDLLTEQAAAFYDYDEKKLFLLDVSSFSDEMETLAHELSHALADQHFDLQKYMDDTSSDDDANMARTAVVEGQASWLMIAYALKENGQPPAPTEKMLQEAFGGGSSSVGDYPVLKASPLYIQQSLLFPYSEGTLFFDAVYRKEGKESFSAVFTDPPVDSAQIIHPGRYFTHVKATKPKLPTLSPVSTASLSKRGADTISEGDVGEFDHEMMIWQYADEKQAKQLAPHLRGGQFKIVGVGKDQHPVLLYASEWDNAGSAGQFFGLYRHILETKWKGSHLSTANNNLYAGEGDNGYFVTRLQNNEITSIEGLASEADWKRLTPEAPTAMAAR